MIDFKGAIFDADGTMLDSMLIWETVVAEYLIRRGADPRPDLNARLLALGGHEIPAYLQDAYGLRNSAEDIQHGIYELLEEFYFYRVVAKPGVTQVLDMLRERGVKMCVATATDRRLMEPALRRCGLLEYFSRIFTCGEEYTSKSSPEIYIRAAAFLGTDISETLVFEDAPYAVKSAKKAGFTVVAVYDSSADDRLDEIREFCDYFIMTMDEFPELVL